MKTATDTVNAAVTADGPADGSAAGKNKDAKDALNTCTTTDVANAKTAVDDLKKPTGAWGLADKALKDALADVVTKRSGLAADVNK